MNENLEQIKASLDILTIAELYGELVKMGANYKYKNDNSVVINPSKQIFSDFSGDVRGGSVLDLIAYMEKLPIKEAIKRLKELAGADTYRVDPATQLKRKEEENRKKVVDFRRLGLFAKNDLEAGQKKKPVLIEEDGKSWLLVNDVFQKLFERKEFPSDYQAKFDYLHAKFLGFDEFYQCPSIIIRDRMGMVVDKIAYRPNKPENYTQWSDPKYIYKNSEERGVNFLYPFQNEVEKILKRDDYIIVGEGIKNALNALIHGVPFITVESTSAKAEGELIAYIKGLLEKKYRVLFMFDGDKAGAKAHQRFKDALGVNIENFFDFTSGDDFTSYMAEEA